MVTNKHGIPIDDGTFWKVKSKANVQKQNRRKHYDRYVEMRHIVFKCNSVVTPYDLTYIKQLESEGYKLVDNFKVYGIGG